MMHNFTVTFRNSFGCERCVASISENDRETAYKKAWDAIMTFLDEHHYKSYYQRITSMRRRGIDDVEWIDVGSYTEFFYIYPIDSESVNLEEKIDAW